MIICRTEKAQEMLENLSRSCGYQRRFSIILYPDYEGYKWCKAVDEKYRYPYIEQWLDDNKSIIKHWCYVTHTEDVDVDGKPKKPHIHLGIQFVDNYKANLLTVADWFGLPTVRHISCPTSSNWHWKTWGAQRQYYNHDLVEGKKPSFHTFHSDMPYTPKSGEKTLNKANRRIEEGNELAIILEILEEVQHDWYLSDFVHRIVECGVWSTYRRAQSTFISLFKEEVYKKEQLSRLRSSSYDSHAL